jgi:hypothetical protein
MTVAAGRDLRRDGDTLHRVMHRRSFLQVALSIALAPVAHGADTRVLTEMRRYLRAIQFGETFQGGVRKIAEKPGGSSGFLDRVLSASPEEIEATVAPAFASRVTAGQAREIADFFASPLGQKLLVRGRQHIGERDAPVDLSAAEQAQVEKFGQTPAGRIGINLTADPDVRKDYFELLRRKYGD